MSDYFTRGHFELLKQWQGQKRDTANHAQNSAYEELKHAYELTEAWARGVQTKLFPTGRVSIRKRPTNQGNVFQHYNWARIYPAVDSPSELAYTVSIESDEGFVVKIDTVGLSDKSKTRCDYLVLRETYDNASPIIAILPASEGLGKSLAWLIDWSADAIGKFRIPYTDMAVRLNLAKKTSDEDLLQHFDGKPAFKTFRASWSVQEKTTFCRLANVVHDAGLDWWHMGNGTEVRFGRKHPDNVRAICVLGLINGRNTRKVSLRRDIGLMAKLNREPLTDDLVDKIEAALRDGCESLDEWLELETERTGLWPDQLHDEPDGVDEAFEDEPVSMNQNKAQAFNRIYYGPPGTGKTYQLSRLLRESYEQATTSVSTDRWQAQFVADRFASLKWWEVIVVALIDLGGKASVSQLLEHPFIGALATAKGGRKVNLRQTLWATLQERTVDESNTVKRKLRFSPQVFDKSEDSIWRLAGEWTEVCEDLVSLHKEFQTGSQSAETLHYYSFVTFHQSYGYEEFVEGLRPVLDDSDVSGAIKYEIRSGVFKELCRKARRAPDQRFAMVIDEINRGNISKIFGELITLIEPDKREGENNAISVTLPYSGESFSVPSNVDIIGTMNTADRSLALLDTALRRRFDFVPVLPDARDEPGAPLYGLRVRVDEQEIDIPRMLAVINQRIESLYDHDHSIGHAYFTSLFQVMDGPKRLDALSQIFKNRIVPLLEEYFFEDWQKIRLVLADNQKPEPSQFVVEIQDHERDLAHLFGRSHGLDTYATKPRYKVMDASFANMDAYIGIYRMQSV